MLEEAQLAVEEARSEQAQLKGTLRITTTVEYALAVVAPAVERFRRLHPDLNPGDAAARQAFQDLTQAYALLIDPLARARWDREAAQEFPFRGGPSDGTVRTAPRSPSAAICNAGSTPRAWPVATRSTTSRAVFTRSTAPEWQGANASAMASD